MAKKNAAVIEAVHKSQMTGLSDEEIKKRIEAGLTNNQKQKTSKSYLKIFAQNILTFFNLIWVIMFAALLIVGETNSLWFMTIVIANTGISIIQEIRSKRTVEKLSLVTAPKITAIRNSEEVEIKTAEIVRDDVLKFESGNQIPADCIIIGGEVYVNESLLTGESVPIKKIEGDELKSGSFLTAGACYARADKVGSDCYIQQLAKNAKAFKQPKSDLFRDLNKIIKFIGIFIIPVGCIMFFHNYRQFGPAEINRVVASTAGALAGMIPSGMYLLVSVALAVGVMKLAKKRTLVQNLYSIEMLARTNVLCLDKTGTITDGTMSVHTVTGNTEQISKLLPILLRAQQTFNNTSRALVKFFGTETEVGPSANISFSSDRKYTATSFSEGTVAIGAHEYIKCPMSKKMLSEIDSFASKGYRVLTVAFSSGQIKDDELPSGLSPCGLIVIEDTIRPDASETIAWFKKNDVEVKIISGDDPQTVSFIAGRVGVPHADKYVNLEGMSLNDVGKIADKYTVFGRVSPEQKHALVVRLKELGKTVAMTGDGVNDTLALKEADCSIAMADGSEVARNISHLVLLDSKFSSLPVVVEEGRRVINNVQNSSSLFFMKTIFTILLSLTILPFNMEYPFKPSQIIPLEFLSIGVPSFFLALLPNKQLITGSFSATVIKRSFPYGFFMFLSVFSFLWLGNGFLIDDAELATAAMVVCTFVSIFNLYSICYPYNKYKLAIISASTLGLVIFMTFPVFGEFYELALSSLSLVTSKCILLYVSIFALLVVIYNIFRFSAMNSRLKKEISVLKVIKE